MSNIIRVMLPSGRTVEYTLGPLTFVRPLASHGSGQLGSVQQPRQWLMCDGGHAFYCNGAGVDPNGDGLPGTQCVGIPGYDSYCGDGTYFLTIPQYCPSGGCSGPGGQAIQNCCCEANTGEGGPGGMYGMCGPHLGGCPQCPSGMHHVDYRPGKSVVRR